MNWPRPAVAVEQRWPRPARADNTALSYWPRPALSPKAEYPNLRELMRLLIGDQEWRADAQCRKEGVPTERFFPWRGESQTAAKECCSRCPVRQECYDFAVENDERGIFGGVLFSR